MSEKLPWKILLGHVIFLGFILSSLEKKTWWLFGDEYVYTRTS